MHDTLKCSKVDSHDICCRKLNPQLCKLNLHTPEPSNHEPTDLLNMHDTVGCSQIISHDINGRKVLRVGGSPRYLCHGTCV